MDLSSLIDALEASPHAVAWLPGSDALLRLEVGGSGRWCHLRLESPTALAVVPVEDFDRADGWHLGPFMLNADQVLLGSDWTVGPISTGQAMRWLLIGAAVRAVGDTGHVLTPDDAHGVGRDPENRACRILPGPYDPRWMVT